MAERFGIGLLRRLRAFGLVHHAGHHRRVNGNPTITARVERKAGMRREVGRRD